MKKILYSLYLLLSVIMIGLIFLGNITMLKIGIMIIGGLFWIVVGYSQLKK